MNGVMSRLFGQTHMDMSKSTVLCFAASCALAALVLYGGVICILQFVVIFAVVAAELLRRKRGTAWDYLSVISGIFILIFVVIPFLLLTSDKFNTSYLYVGDVELLKLYTVILVGYLSILLGYSIVSGDRPPARDNERVRALDRIFVAGLAMYVVGVTSFFIYADLYGGVQGLFKAAENIRAGHIGDSQYVFVRRFMAFSAIGAWIVLYKIYHADIPVLIKFLLTPLIMAIPLTSAFATAGRLDVVFTALPLYLAGIHDLTRRVKVASVAAVGVICLAWFVYGDMVFAAISYDVKLSLELETDQAMVSLANDFRHPFVSLVVAVDNVPETVNYRGITDFVYGFGSLIPSRLFDREIPMTITSFNTFFIEGSSLATIPPGLVAFSYYSYAVVGVMVWCAMFGVILRLGERFAADMVGRDRTYLTLYFALLLAFIHLFMSGDPKIFLQNYFFLYTGAIGLLLVGKAKPNITCVMDHVRHRRFD